MKSTAIKLYKQGKPMACISETTGYSRQHILKLAKSAGCEVRRSTVNKICPVCGKAYTTQGKKQKQYCNQDCYLEHLKNTNSSYGNKQYKGCSVRSWQRKARQVAIEALGDSFIKTMRVHHNDSDISNNDRLNLFVFFSDSKHLAFHHKRRKNSRCKPSASDGIQL
jgi:hypothetical protein